VDSYALDASPSPAEAEGDTMNWQVEARELRKDLDFWREETRKVVTKYNALFVEHEKTKDEVLRLTEQVSLYRDACLRLAEAYERVQQELDYMRTRELGEHDTEAAARAQLRATEASKHKVKKKARDRG